MNIEDRIVAQVGMGEGDVNSAEQPLVVRPSASSEGMKPHLKKNTSMWKLPPPVRTASPPVCNSVEED